MNATLWALQVLLALAFAAHGMMFLAPPAEMVEQMNASIPPALRLFIGGAELAAAVGLIVPGLARIMPGLVAAAAAGLAVVMISASIFHLNRGEWSSAAVTTVLLALTAFVAYARWKIRPIPPRGALDAV